MKKVYLTITFLSIINVLDAQNFYEGKSDVINNDIIEDRVIKTSSSYDFSDMIDEISIREGFIVNLNKAEEVDLKKLNLNEVQIKNLYDYIKKYGALTSIYELNLIEGYDSALIEKISPNIRFLINQELYPITANNLLYKGKNTILLREQRVNDKDDDKFYDPDQIDSANADNIYAGSRDKVLLKYGYNYGDRLRFGVTFEKDAGESMNKGFDFMSFHFLYKSTGIIRKILFGDYNLRFGQGLTIGTGFSPATDPMSGSYILPVNTVNPSTAANEGLGLSGAVITLSLWDRTNLTLFYSDRQLDGLVISNEDSISAQDEYNGINYAQSLTETGLHRTTKEIANKNTIEQNIIGGNITSGYKWIRIGATALCSTFDPEILKEEIPYKLYHFNGRRLLNFGTDISVICRSFIFFSEISGSDNGFKAFTGGLKAELPGGFGISLIYRNYGKDYNNFFSSAFSQNSECRNETGFYRSIYVKVDKRCLLSAGADVYTFPWIKYRTDAPSAGREYFFRSETLFNNHTILKIKYSFHEKSLNKTSAVFFLNYPILQTEHKARLDLNYSPLENFSFQNRIESSLNIKDQKMSRGFILYQDIEYHKKGLPIKVNFRYLIFDTEDYDSRIYTYENDLLYAWNVPAFSGEGNRIYTMVKYDVGKYLSLWLKYSLTRKFDTPESDDNLTNIHEFKLQAILKI